MNHEKLRLGLVGYGTNKKGCELSGGRGESLFRYTVDGIEGVEAAAVCDLNPIAREKAEKKYPGIRVFADYREMFAARVVDAVIVGTPVQFHAPIALTAMEFDTHILSEIPCVWTLEEAEQLWSAQANSSALYMTGANPNFCGYIDAMVDLAERGLLGNPIFAEAEYVHDLRHLWDFTPWRVGMEPIRYCTHSLGPLLRVISEDLQSVSCFSTGSHLNDREGDDDFMTATFRTQSNVVVRLLVSFINNVTSHHHYRIFTSKGSFERTRPEYTSMGFVPAESPRTLFHSTDLPYTNNRMELPIGDMPPRYASNPKATGHGGTDYAMVDAFIHAIRTGGPSPISLREGLRMSLPGIFAAESARRGGELIKISYPWENKGIADAFA